MLRLALLAALVLAPAALADGGPGPGVVIGGTGVLTANGAIRYVTVGSQSETTVEAVRTSDGRVLRNTNLSGSWGIPAVAYDFSAGGLSHNNRTLVLEQQSVFASQDTKFLIVDPKRLDSYPLVVKGDFTYDALSPNGNTLYLIDHVSASNANRYDVRAYDLVHNRLLPRVIADRTQRGWVMQGIPVARTQSPDGRFVYTLYQNPGGYPFVHQLDTVRGVAHCIGVPFKSDQSVLMSAKLTLASGGRKLAIVARSGTSLYRLEVATYDASAVQPRTSGFAWWWVAVAAAAIAAFGLAAARVTRRLRHRAAPA